MRKMLVLFDSPRKGDKSDTPCDRITQGANAKKVLGIFMMAILLFVGLAKVPASAATTLKINWKNATIGIDENFTLTTNADSNKTVYWTSSDRTVAPVNKSGEVVGKKAGKTTITASVDDMTATCEVTVKRAPDRISAKNVIVNVDSTAQIMAMLPENTASKTLTYKSSDNTIAKVNNAGIVTGVKTGRCTVTVDTYNKKSVRIQVTVTDKTDSEILVAYFSMPETASSSNMTREEDNSVVVVNGEVLGNTQYLAYLIQENTNADIFRIEPKIPYPTNHATLVELAAIEQNNKARPILAANVENIEQYSVIFLGYPNWWGDMPMILYSFLESENLSGKTIIPFNSHGGSGFSDTINTIAKLQPNATVEKNGFTVNRNRVEYAESSIVAWLLELGIIGQQHSSAK